MAQNKSFETIQPADIPLTQPQSGGGEPNRRFSQKLVVGIGLAIALLLALAVIFVLPQMVSTPDKDAVNEALADEQLGQSERLAAAKPVESPWSEAQLAKARRAAQDILAKLLERQTFLENKSVKLWAVERYQQGLDAASEGDNTFREREFDQALENFQLALDIFTELENQVDQTLADNLQAGFRAIDKGDQDTARQHFELALAIDAGNSQAGNGLARTETLAKVLLELEQAGLARKNNQLETARDHFQVALKLDSQHRAAREGLQDIGLRIIERDYIEALSSGYSNLEQGQLARARTAFNQALKLRPDSSEARRGLEQATDRLSRLTLTNQLATASQREQEENWQAAETLYNQILRNDSSVVEARAGQIRSRTRAQLDSKLQDLIKHSMRLTSSNVYSEAQQLLQEARAINPRGARLNKQIASLQTALIKAATLWPTEFRSDNQTDVTLFRVGKLGQFDNKTLKLKPGRYIATGTRKGYRDVRVEFQITGTKQHGPIVIQCKDII